MLSTLPTYSTRRSKWALPPQARAGMLVALMTGLLAGCIVIPAKPEVTRSGEVQVPSGGTALSVLFSRDFSPETPKGLGEEMVKCITRGIAEAAPEVRLVPEEVFHLSVFGVKPGEVLLRADTITKLLARPDIRERIGEAGLTHLILVGGDTHTHGGQSFFGAGGGAGAAVVVGGAEGKRSTRLTASIFDLARGAAVGGIHASAEGRQGMFMIFPMVLGWVHATESSSCDALGAEVARAIRARPSDATP